MEKKQSSIDYFFEEVVKWQMKPWLYASDGLEPLFEQAKALHKEEIEDAWLNGMKGEMIAPLSINNYKPDAEEYYSETFGGNNE